LQVRLLQLIQLIIVHVQLHKLLISQLQNLEETLHQDHLQYQKDILILQATLVLHHQTHLIMSQAMTILTQLIQLLAV